MSLEWNADAVLADFGFGALSRGLAECVLTTAAHAVSAQTTITIDAAFCRDTGELIADRPRPTVDVDDTFAHKRTHVVDTLEIWRTLIVPGTFDRDGCAGSLDAEEALRAILVEYALLGRDTLVVVASESLVTIGVDGAGDCVDACIFKADRIRRTFEVSRALNKNTLAVKACRLNALIRTVFVDDTSLRWLTDASIACVSVRAIRVVSTLANVDAYGVAADLTGLTVPITAASGLTNSIGAGFAGLTIRRRGADRYTGRIATQEALWAVGAVETDVGGGAKRADTLRA